MENKNVSVYATLSAVNVNDYTKVKNGLSFLPWAQAWAEVKKRYPDATYNIIHNADGWNYHTDGRTAWVECSVTINGLEHTEHLPVMNNRNQSIPVGQLTSMDVLKAIQRCITKACSRHGLGLYIYAGEELTDNEQTALKEETAKNTAEACREISAVTSHEELVQVWQKWAGIVPHDSQSEFHKVATAMAQQYPKQ